MTEVADGEPVSGVGGSSYTDSMNFGDVEPASVPFPLYTAVIACVPGSEYTAVHDAVPPTTGCAAHPAIGRAGLKERLRSRSA